MEKGKKERKERAFPLQLQIQKELERELRAGELQKKRIEEKARKERLWLEKKLACHLQKRPDLLPLLTETEGDGKPWGKRMSQDPQRDATGASGANGSKQPGPPPAGGQKGAKAALTVTVRQEGSLVARAGPSARPSGQKLGGLEVTNRIKTEVTHFVTELSRNVPEDTSGEGARTRGQRDGVSERRRFSSDHAGGPSRPRDQPRGSLGSLPGLPAPKVQAATRADTARSELEARVALGGNAAAAEVPKPTLPSLPPKKSQKPQGLEVGRRRAAPPARCSMRGNVAKGKETPRRCPPIHDCSKAPSGGGGGQLPTARGRRALSSARGPSFPRNASREDASGKKEAPRGLSAVGATEAVVKEVYEKVKELLLSKGVLRESPSALGRKGHGSTKSVKTSASSPANAAKELGSVAEEVVPKKPGKDLASGASEELPGRGAGRPRRTARTIGTQVDLPASDLPFSLACVEKVTKEAVESVALILEEFAAFRLNQDAGCHQDAFTTFQHLCSEVHDYAKAAVRNILVILRKNLEEESQHRADASWYGAEDEDTLANEIVDSILGRYLWCLADAPSGSSSGRRVSGKQPWFGKEPRPAQAAFKPQGREIPVRMLEKRQPRSSLQVPALAVYSEDETQSEEETLGHLLPSVPREHQSPPRGIRSSSYCVPGSAGSSSKPRWDSQPARSSRETLPVLGQQHPREPFPPACAKPPWQRLRRTEQGPGSPCRGNRSDGRGTRRP